MFLFIPGNKYQSPLTRYKILIHFEIIFDGWTKNRQNPDLPDPSPKLTEIINLKFETFWPPSRIFSWNPHYVKIVSRNGTQIIVQIITQCWVTVIYQLFCYNTRRSYSTLYNYPCRFLCSISWTLHSQNTQQCISFQLRKYNIL